MYFVYFSGLVRSITSSSSPRYHVNHNPVRWSTTTVIVIWNQPFDSMNLSIRLSRLQLKHCFDFFTRSRNDQLLWVNWQIRCTFHLTYIADHRSTLARWMTQADRRSWTSVIARKSLYLLSFFVVAHICMTFTVSKSHRLAISRHFLPKQKPTKRCFHEVIQTILPRSIAQLSRQCDRIASWYTSDPVFFLQLACGHSRLNSGPIQKKGAEYIS